MAKYYASKVVAQMQKWVGKKESNGTHKEIIDIYNTYKPHPRGYEMTYDAPWCATTVSAVAIKLGYTEIIPVECSCSKMIELAKKKGIWVESDSRTPKPGDFMLYDWDDNGKGDNVGSPDHIGVVEKVSNNIVTVIEGNIKDSVDRRQIKVNGKFIRGYIVPKYNAEPKKKVTKKAYSGTFPKLPTRGYFQYGDVGTQVKYLQKFLNWYGGYKLDVDGEFGAKTLAAVRDFQKKNGLTVDGLFGKKSLTKAKIIVK